MKRLLAFVLVLGLCVPGFGADIAALSNIANGDTSDGPTVMGNFNLIRDEVNGSLDNDNIVAAAGIVESKLNLNALSLTNLVERGNDMETWNEGTTVQPSGWTAVGTPTIAQDTALQGAGSYAVKITGAGADDEGSSVTLTNMKISTVYRVTALVKATSGDTASITTTGATTNMDEDSTTASWTTVTGTFTTDGSGTDVVLQLLAQNDTDIVWFDNVCVTEGTAKVGFVPNHVYHGRIEGWTNTASSYAGRFKNDGDNVNRFGLNVRFGEDTPAGTNYCLRGFDGDGDEDGGLRSVAGTFAAYNTCDKKLKKNIKDTAKKGKATIMALKVRDFEYKKNPGRVKTGFIAQEVAAVYPDAVGDPTPEGLYMFSNTELIAPMIKHMQEMQEKIDELEMRLQAIEGN